MERKRASPEHDVRASRGAIAKTWVREGEPLLTWDLAQLRAQFGQRVLGANPCLVW